MLNKGSNTELAIPMTYSVLLKEEITRVHQSPGQMPPHLQQSEFVGLYNTRRD